MKSRIRNDPLEVTPPPSRYGMSSVFSISFWKVLLFPVLQFSNLGKCHFRGHSEIWLEPPLHTIYSDTNSKIKPSNLIYK